MTTVVLCDGVKPSRVVPADRTIRIASNDRDGNLYIHIESPQHALGATVHPVSSDLLRIAAYVYGVDQEVSRGGDADIYGASWQRDFHVYAPVSDVTLWNKASVALEDALYFLTGDRWYFHFSPATASEVVPLQLSLDPMMRLGNPDSVYLLSGGMDSLCAVADAVARGRRPLLVGQSPANNIKGRHNRVVSALMSHFGSTWTFPDVIAAITRTDLGDPSDSTQRSRGFLFASLASVFALRVGLPEANFSDNGVVSLNLPLNRQVVNTRASRSTHPKFIRLFNELLRVLFPDPPAVVNPLLLKTRPEALEMLKAAGAGLLARETVSCVHTRLMKKHKDHCGVCSQCIDRRFAMVASGLDATESTARYDQDIFVGELRENEARTMAASYHSFISAIEVMSDDGIMEAYAELYEASQPHDRLQPVGLCQLLAMLRRHSAISLHVVEEVVARNRGELARGTLPPTCLLRLINPSAGRDSVSTNGQPVQAADARHETGVPLTPAQAELIRILQEARLQGEAPLSHAKIIARLHQAEYSTHRVTDLFSKAPQARALIVSPKKGYYDLAE